MNKADSGNEIGMTAVSMRQLLNGWKRILYYLCFNANPHAVTFVDDTDSLPLEQPDNIFEKHEIPGQESMLPEFVQVLNRKKKLRCVYGNVVQIETLACGTGTCAAVVACAVK